MLPNEKHQNFFIIALTVLCAGLITWTGIVYGQLFYRMLPLYISLVVGVLQSKASRYAPLLGSMNCLLYTAVYTGLGLYANAANALLVGFPLQLLTFLRWNRRAYKSSTQFRSLSVQQWLFGGLSFAAMFTGSNLLLSALDSGYAFWDSAAALMDILVNILRLFAFREYTWLMFISSGASIILNCSMLPQLPSQITFVIYAIHAFICIVVQFFSVRRLYAEQRKELSHENDPS